MDPICKLKSTILPSLKKTLLFRGSFIASLGAVFLIYTGTQLSQETLSNWGLVFFFGSLLLIRFGLVPYRKICKKELHFDELFLFQNHLSFRSKDHGTFHLEFSDIASIDYSPHKIYGIQIFFKEGAFEKIKAPKEYQQYRDYCKKKWECDWFLPYFSHPSYEKLQASLQDIVHS